MKTCLATIGILLFTASSAVATSGLNLRVTVSGLSPGEGQVIVSLFNDKEQFLRQPQKIITLPVPDSNRLSVEFEQLEPGIYAVSAVYDKDSDGELDTGLFRIPSEPIGVSNNVRSKFGPPSWKKARFDLQQDMNLEIRVVDAIE